MNNGIAVQKDYLEIPVYNSLPLHGIGNKSNIPEINNSEFGLYNPNNFVLVFDTSKEPSNLQISVPLGGTVNCTIFWGDGTNNQYTTTGFKTHVYEKPGVYIVQISGTVTALGDGNFTASNTNNKQKLVECLSFGNFRTTRIIFSNYINLVTCPNTIPNYSIYITFNGCTLMNNSNIMNWASANLNSLRSTFSGTRFNQRIDHWYTSNVTDMFAAFSNNSTFNQNISSFDTSRVTQMHYMFFNASSFNQPIGGWNTSNVTLMDYMLSGASAFNQPINSWNTANVTNMTSTFQNATSFNQPLNNWNVRKVTNFTSMFQGATSFNSSLSGWALGADTAGATCASMFFGATNFNQDISNWDTSKVTSMNSMFAHTGSNAFNQNIGGWNVSNVTNFATMFWSNSNNLPFNQNLGSWNVSKGTTFQEMFRGCVSVSNQDLRNWNIAGISTAAGLDNFMINQTGSNAISTANYDALLIGWNNNKLASANGVANWRTDLRPNFGGAKYTAGGAAAAARAALVSYGWTITDGGTA